MGDARIAPTEKLMKAYLPKTRPLSGDYPEKWFGESTGDGVAALFEDSEYDDWLGIFQKGIYPYSFAKVESRKVIGEFWLVEWKPFVLDVDTWQIEEG